MKATYFIPRKPDSVPFINKEADLVEIMIDGEFISMSYSMFTKLFQEEEYREPDPQVVFDSDGFFPEFQDIDVTDLDSTMNSLKEMTEMLKSFGIKKEMIYESMDRMLDAKNMSHAKSTARQIIDNLFKD